MRPIVLPGVMQNGNAWLSFWFAFFCSQQQSSCRRSSGTRRFGWIDHYHVDIIIGLVVLVRIVTALLSLSWSLTKGHFDFDHGFMTIR